MHFYFKQVGRSQGRKIETEEDKRQNYKETDVWPNPLSLIIREGCVLSHVKCTATLLIQQIRQYEQQTSLFWFKGEDRSKPV